MLTVSSITQPYAVLLDYCLLISWNPQMNDCYYTMYVCRTEVCFVSYVIAMRCVVVEPGSI